MSDKSVKVLVVDDTVVYRKILTEVIRDIPGCTVVGVASNGKLALARLESTPVDLVLLDVEMPEMGGLETLVNIKATYPDIGVIMVSGVDKSAVATTIEALEKGALDFVPKPTGSDMEISREQLTRHLKRIIQLFSTQHALKTVSRRQEATKTRKASPAITIAAPPRIPAPMKGKKPAKIDILVVGVSTGGPKALADFLPQLPGDLGVPVLLVQHMPPMFTASLAESLASKSQLTVKEAHNGETILPNTVYIAPGGRHMLVRRKVGEEGYSIGLNDSPPENHCRPAVDVLFRSVATHFGGNVLAVIMTGMGDDGCKGVKALKRQGCYCITQNEATCIVYGMPRAVNEAALSDEQVPLSELSHRVTRILEKTR